MNNNSGYIKVLVLIILFLSVFIGVYYFLSFYRSSDYKKESIQENIIKVNPEISNENRQLVGINTRTDIIYFSIPEKYTYSFEPSLSNENVLSYLEINSEESPVYYWIKVLNYNPVENANNYKKLEVNGFEAYQTDKEPSRNGHISTYIVLNNEKVVQVSISVNLRDGESEVAKESQKINSIYNSEKYYNEYLTILKLFTVENNIQTTPNSSLKFELNDDRLTVTDSINKYRFSIKTDVVIDESFMYPEETKKYEKIKNNGSIFFSDQDNLIKLGYTVPILIPANWKGNRMMPNYSITSVNGPFNPKEVWTEFIKLPYFKYQETKINGFRAYKTSDLPGGGGGSYETTVILISDNHHVFIQSPGYGLENKENKEFFNFYRDILNSFETIQ